MPFGSGWCSWAGRRPRLARLAALTASTALSLVVVLVYGAAVAEAQPSIGCEASSPGPDGVLDMLVSGTSSPSDSLTVTESGGEYSVTLVSGGSSSSVCTGYADSGGTGFPTFAVTGTTLVATDFIAADSGLTFNGQAGVANTLDLSQASGTPATVNVSGATVGGVANDTASVATVPVSFSNVSSFVGLAAGDTTFIAGSTGGFTFAGTGSGNALDLGAAGSGVSASVQTGQITLASGTDQFSGISHFVGSSSGGTTVQAGSGPMTFTGAGTGNVLDLSQVTASQSTPLSVNVSGATVGGVDNDTAAVGTLTDSFTDVSSFVGSADGNTMFQANGAGGFTFDGGVSGGNALDLSAAGSGLSVSVPAGTVSFSPSGSDQFSGISTFDGPAAGGATFAAASTGGDTFNGAGNGNTLNLALLQTSSSELLLVNVSGTNIAGVANDTAAVGSSTDAFSGISTFDGASTGHTTFFAGSAADSFSGTGSGNTLDLSFASASSASVSVSGVTMGIVSDSVTGVTRFVGLAAGNTTFRASSTGGFTFVGDGSGNVLDLGAAGSAVSASVPTGEITLASGTDQFSGISDLLGSSSGGTTVQAGSGSMTFTGAGAGNVLDLSQLTTSLSTPLSVNVSGGSATVGTDTDSFSDVSSFVGSADGDTTFVAGSAGGFTFDGGGSGNTLDLSAAGAASVAVNGDSIMDPGTVTGLTANGTDGFADIEYFPGAATITSGVESPSVNLTAATVGAAYSVQLTGSGGTGTYSGWSVKSGALPPGLTLSGSGLLSGTPSTSGSYSFVIALSDADALPFAISYTLTVELRPFVTISSPADGATETSSPVTVAGTAGGDSGVKSVTVNGVTATVSGGTWSTTVPLTQGANTLTATMTTSDGSAATGSATVYYEPPERISLMGKRFNGKAVLVKLGCAASGSACAGKITVRYTETVVRHHKKHRTTLILASKPYGLDHGYTATFSAALNGTGRRLLEAHAKLAVKGTVTVSQFGHTKTAATFGLTLKQPAKRT